MPRGGQPEPASNNSSEITVRNGHRVQHYMQKNLNNGIQSGEEIQYAAILLHIIITEL